MTEPEPIILSGRRIVLGVTGGIAAYKTAELVRGFRKAGAEVQVVMTHAATRFVTPLTLGTLSQREVLIDIFPENESGSWTRHVHLGRWADLFVVAPATANTLAKLAHGVCDSMLTAVALSTSCPVLICPAMDHDMYEHASVRQNLDTLASRGCTVMPAEHGELASGLVGKGRLPEPETILRRVAALLGASAALSGRHVLVTAGPTREALDPVRFLTNHSTGTMGCAIADEAARRGARVTLVAGPGCPPTLSSVERIDVVSAQDMDSAAMPHAGADIVIAAAAVSDYAAAAPSDLKLKKTEDDLTLELRRTPDILGRIGAQRTDRQVLIGFALETDRGEENARTKLERKNLDWIVLNDPGEAGAGFGPSTNRVTIFGRDGARHDLPLLPKTEVAEHILDLIPTGNG